MQISVRKLYFIWLSILIEIFYKTNNFVSIFRYVSSIHENTGRYQIKTIKNFASISLKSIYLNL